MKDTNFISKLMTIAAAIALVPASANAQVRSPDKPPAKDNSVEAEMASFEIHEDFKVSLFADETLGIANPVAIHWDHRGRLWVLTTLAYAQLKPGEIPDDKVIILEDSDGDGRADKSTVFAKGLDMSTGFALGGGGVYLAEGPDLVLLSDTDGDGVADQRKLLLTGFGTGDTHQNISNLKIDSGGFLYFSQGLHAFSTVETPWGVSRGERAGFWRFDPRTTRLDPFCFPGMASANPCGIALDRWGALFVKSNGTHLCFATPGLIPTTHPKELMQLALIGETPGKSMGAEIVETAHQPDWLQQHTLISGYFARQVNALPLIEEGAGFKTVEPVPLLVADHPSFRPVDIRVGPDGGIYIADWFNPVINHYQVSLRHPHRDYDHGRIWKLSAKARPPVEPPVMDNRSPRKLFEHLRSPERWTRDQARRLLSEMPVDKVSGALTRWALKLDPKSADGSHALVEAAGILESHRIVQPNLLDRLQESTQPHARAVVARIIARAADPIDDADQRLAVLLRDPHPRPRLEAVIACANRPKAESITLAMTALDADIDKNIDYSLSQAVHALRDHWLPALEAGDLEFERPRDLAFALETLGSEVGAKHARAMLGGMNELLPSTRLSFLRILAHHGTAGDLRRILDEPDIDSPLLDTLIAAWKTRRLKPAAPFAPRLGELLKSDTAAVRVAAIRLSGLWRATDLADAVESLALDANASSAVRSAALTSLASLRGKASASQLAKVALSKNVPAPIQQSAMQALTTVNLTLAAESVVELIHAPDTTSESWAILKPLLLKTGGPAALVTALAEVELRADVAKKIAGTLAGLGRTDAELTKLTNKALGVKGTGPAEADYDPERVKKIVAAVNAGKGDAGKGRSVYQLIQLNCVACHQIDKIGGVTGPPLDTVGAGLPLDQIVESVLWPARQLKEGYFATAITTVDEQVHTGYVDAEFTNSANVWLRDIATNELRPVSQHQLLKREEIGTLMPAGLTNSLSEDQLNDLIAYLASLKG